MTTNSELPRWTRVAAYALCADEEDRILLVRISSAYPAAGSWTLPGGGLEFGEDPQAAVVRELAEETGLSGVVRSIAFVDSRARAEDPERGVGAWHAIRIVYRVDVVGGELRDERDESTDAAAWFARAEAERRPLVDLVQVALRYLDGG